MPQKAVVAKLKNPGGRPRKYSEEILVDAALRVMEREGFAALSIRSLAREVGTTHATLYNYIGTIEEIEAKAILKLSQLLPPPTASAGPALRAELMAYLMSIRVLLMQHPGVLLSAADSATAKSFTRISDQWIDVLQPHATNPQLGRVALGLITSTLLTSVVRDVMFAADRRTGKRKAAQQQGAAAIEQALNELIDLLLPGLAKAGKPGGSRAKEKTRG